VRGAKCQGEGNPKQDKRDDHARGDDQAGNDGVRRAPHFVFAVDFFLFLENRDERRRQRAFPQQPPEQVRDRERILECIVDPARAHETVINHLAHHAEHAAGERGGGHRPGRFEHLRHRAKG
jgi:hypothetical protein